MSSLLLVWCHFVYIFVDVLSQNNFLGLIYTWQWSPARLKLKCFSYLCCEDTLFSPSCSSASICVHSQLIFISLGWTPTERQVSGVQKREGWGEVWPGLPQCPPVLRLGGGPMGGRSVSVWQLNILLRISQTGSKRSPHGNLMIQSLCDVSGETDTGGKMCPVGSIIQSRQYGASSRHSLTSSTSLNIIHFVCFVLKRTNISAIRLHIMNQINNIIRAQMVGLCHSAVGGSLLVLAIYSRTGGGRNHTEIAQLSPVGSSE